MGVERLFKSFLAPKAFRASSQWARQFSWRVIFAG
jgi:hypothetical protein